jgi:hypothetical protein
METVDSAQSRRFKSQYDVVLLSSGPKSGALSGPSPSSPIEQGNKPWSWSGRRPS